MVQKWCRRINMNIEIKPEGEVLCVFFDDGKCAYEIQPPPIWRQMQYPSEREADISIGEAGPEEKKCILVTEQE